MSASIRGKRPPMSLAMGAPGKISEVKRNLDGAIVLDDIADIDERVRQIERQNR